MSRNGRVFVVAFVLSAAAVGWFVLADRPTWGLAVGTAGLLLHWAASRGGAHDGELADSSYFLGFLLTLVFLAAGLYRMSALPAAGANTSGAVLGFLEDLAAGLVLTILGLAIRQVRTLANGPAAPEDRLLATQAQLVTNMDALVALWRERPEHAVIRDLSESRAAAREAAHSLEKSVAAAAERMRRSVDRLEESTVTATGSLTRAAAGAGESLSQSAQRLEAELTQVVDGLRSGVGDAVRQIQADVATALSALEQQRVEATEALAAARAANADAQASADAHLQEQVAAWTASLEQARSALTQAQRSLDDEYRRGMEGFAETGTAFAALAAEAAEHVRALPDPAERLAGLWDGVRALEAGLAGAVEGAGRELNVLRERAAALSGELDRLGGSTSAAAGALGAGGEILGDSLRRELEQMNGIIDEYVALLERTTKSLRVPA